MPLVAITAAAGYVGSAIARYFRASGWSVLELGRRKSSDCKDHVFFDLAAEPPAVDWKNVNALVHCAHDFGLTSWPDIERINVRGGIRLLVAAADQGVSGVFISSLSCFRGCRSFYGQAKLAVEREALRLGFAVVRPGLVWGESSGGMTGALERAVQWSPIVPVIGGASFAQYAVHEDDLARAVFALCQRHHHAPAEPVSAAADERIPFREVLAKLAGRQGRRPIFVPVPWRLILLGLRTLEAFRLSAPFRSDSLVGLVHQNPAPDFSVARRLGFSFRRFA